MATPNTIIVETDGPLNLQYNGASDIDLTTQYPDERAFLALRSYLQPGEDASKSLQLTVDRIVEAFPNDSGSSYGYRDLIEVVFDLAEQIHFQHAAHSKLIDALWALRNDEKLGKKPGFTKNIQSPVDAFDQVFSERLSELFGGFEDPVSYVNFNAFHARVQNSQLKMPGSWATAIMRAAFAPERDMAKRAEREACILGAAQWILWDGQAAYQDCCSRQSTQGQPTLKDWSSWKQGFEDCSLGEKVGDECKVICKIVVGMMEKLAQKS